MPKPPARKLDLPPTPAPVETKRGAKPPTRVTPVQKKIGERPGNLKARAEAFKRRTGAR